MNLLPIFDSMDEGAVHAICFPGDEDSTIRIAVSPLGKDVIFLEAKDIQSVILALNYDNTFSFARTCALKTLKRIVEHYEDNMWLPDETDDFDDFVRISEYSDVRREVWELVRECCAQERRLLDEVKHVLNMEEDSLGVR